MSSSSPPVPFPSLLFLFSQLEWRTTDIEKCEEHHQEEKKKAPKANPIYLSSNKRVQAKPGRVESGGEKKSDFFFGCQTSPHIATLSTASPLHYHHHDRPCPSAARRSDHWRGRRQGPRGGISHSLRHGARHFAFLGAYARAERGIHSIRMLPPVPPGPAAAAAAAASEGAAASPCSSRLSPWRGIKPHGDHLMAVF